MILKRLKYYADKVKAAWASGTLAERFARKGKAFFYTSGVVLWRYAALKSADRKLDVTRGFSDHRRQGEGPSAQDLEIVDRLCNAYIQAKRDQPGAPAPFQIRGLWAEWIRVNYGPLVDAITQRNHAAAWALLENSSREQFAVGTGAGYDDLVCYKTSLLGRLYVKTVWCDYRDKMESLGCELSTVRYPLVANPAGIPCNGTILQVETLRHASNAHGMTQLLRDVADPVVVEIGGGFGGQAFQTLSRSRERGHPIRRYYDFDIPEVQLAAGYFLMKALPEEKFRLYGEKADGDDFRVGIFPHFVIETLPDLSADLVFNSHSFSEMDGNSALHYLSIVNRVCRKYFMHINHEVPFAFKQPDGTQSTNVIGSRMVPDAGLFKRVFKHPRVFGRPEDRFFKSFAYLYERIKPE